MSVVDWIMGLSIMFGLAFMFTYLTVQDFRIFLAFLTIFDAFVVWAGLLELWTLILCIIITSLLIYMQLVGEKSDAL